MAAEGGVLRQVDVGGIVGVGDAARAVPRLIGHIGVVSVVARCDAAAADSNGCGHSQSGARRQYPIRRLVP